MQIGSSFTIFLLLKYRGSTTCIDSYCSQIPNRFTLRVQIYSFVVLFVSWYCSKEEKRTHPCIIVILLFLNLVYIEWQRKNMNHGITQLFLSCAFLFFSCLIHCKSENTHLNPYSRERERERDWDRGVLCGNFSLLFNRQTFCFWSNQPKMYVPSIQFLYSSLTVHPPVKYEFLHTHFSIPYTPFSPQPQPKVIKKEYLITCPMMHFTFTTNYRLNLSPQWKK